MRRVVLIAVLLFAASAVAQKHKGAPIYKLPEKTVALDDLKLPAPAQACTNYAAAVALETMLRLQQVPLDQHFWVQKANGGELCIEPVPDFDRLTRIITGTYTLDDGRKFKLETQIIAGAPTSPDQVIAPLTKGFPLLVYWKARAYVLKGVVYDEYIYPNGQRMYQIKEMKLLDPLAPAKEREVSFTNGTDDVADINGVVFVTATPLQQ